MKVPLFEQTLVEFIQSKSNWSGVAAIALGCWMLSKGDLDNSMMLITYGMGVLGIKDAIVKSGK